MDGPPGVVRFYAELSQPIIDPLVHFGRLTSGEGFHLHHVALLPQNRSSNYLARCVANPLQAAAELARYRDAARRLVRTPWARHRIRLLANALL